MFSFQSRLRLEGIFGCEDGKPALLSLCSPRPLPPIWQTNLHQLSQNILQICKLMLIRNTFPKNILQISELMSIRKTFSKTLCSQNWQIISGLNVEPKTFSRTLQKNSPNPRNDSWEFLNFTWYYLKYLSGILSILQEEALARKHLFQMAWSVFSPPTKNHDSLWEKIDSDKCTKRESGHSNLVIRALGTIIQFEQSQQSIWRPKAKLLHKTIGPCIQ